MRKLLTIIFIFIFTNTYFSQTQEKIPWTSLADSPWPVARGDVQGTGRSEYVGPKVPEVKWKKSYPYGMVSGPVIGNEGELYFGTFAVNWINENYFYSVNSLGNQNWKFVTNSWVANDCAPAVGSNGDIYFGSDNTNLYSVNNEGILNWKFESNSAFDVENLILDKVGNIYVGNIDSLYSFDSAGKLRFQINLPGIIGTSLVFSPSGDTLYVQSNYAEGSEYIYHLYAISRHGEVFWSLQFDNIAQSIVIDNSNRIYLQGLKKSMSDHSALYCINPDGSVNWYFNEGAFPSRYDGGPTIDHNGNISFFASLKNESNRGIGIVSLDYNGNLRWIYEFEIEDWFEYSWFPVEHGLVCDAEGTIYVASAFGYYLYAISSEGELLWKLRLKDYYVTSGPVIGGDGLIYIGMHHGSGMNNLENNLWAIGEKASSVEDEELPTEYKLEQNFPNPFNPSTTIKFIVPNVGDENFRPLQTKLMVYNILGQEISTLINKQLQPGEYEIKFDASDLPSGVYFYRLNAGEFSESRKMLLLK